MLSAYNLGETLKEGRYYIEPNSSSELEIPLDYFRPEETLIYEATYLHLSSFLLSFSNPNYSNSSLYIYTNISFPLSRFTEYTLHHELI